ncbi:DUF1850 domain-containing protein [Shouchella patagoniensis]|uniref:DUF1850 domain-containing protein n=1 Tax=Shouchella patagoniensis TaxID=228576 RepID=UPI001FE7684B|nr:DUF1850 domain-containing protein [Shouchella patagoniensis]
MGLRKKKWILFISILATLCFAIPLLFIPTQSALVFYKENTNTLLAYLPIKKDDTFEIVYTHSIHLTDVVEKYKIIDNFKIQQYEMIFEEFGIGMPSYAVGDETFSSEDGRYHIRNMENTFPSLSIRNGLIVPEHRLTWGEESEHSVWFTDYFEPGAWLTMKMDSLSMWQWLKGEQIK